MRLRERPQIGAAFLLKTRIQRTVNKSSLLLARKEDADWPNSTPPDPEPNRRGRVRAKARGVGFGMKPKLTKHQRDEALRG
jgi:hypothetical protein